MNQPMTDTDYQALAAFRTGLRQFLRFSEDVARSAGLTPRQHQLLIAIRGHSGSQPPTIGELAEALQLRHHSVVELIDRAADHGLVERMPTHEDQRRVAVAITPAGDDVLRSLSVAHRAEIRQLESVVRQMTASFADPEATSAGLLAP